MADFSAALGAMKRGLRVRRAGWRNYGLSLAIHDGVLVYLSKVANDAKPLDDMEAADLLATDWEHIPEEPAS